MQIRMQICWTSHVMMVLVDLVMGIRYTIHVEVQDLEKLNGMKLKEYMTLKEASQKWGISDRRINTLCLENRIDGVTKFGKAWAIPKDAQKPKDERVKSGKYIKTLTS